MAVKTLVTVILVGTTCLTSIQVFGQNIKSISGRVIQKSNEPLIGNAIILSAEDSAFIKGVSFLDTTFVLTDINRAEVLLKITSLTTADTLIKVIYRGQPDIDLGAMYVREKVTELGEVIVKAELPLVKYSANGSLEVNVANTVLSASSSVTEILSKTPNVIETNGQLSVLGKGEAIIFLNGRQITNERLASIPVSQILKVEVISNPSAKYDAEGRAVIDIITKIKDEEGILGTASQQVTYSDFAGTNAQTFLDMSYVKSRLSLKGNYSLLAGDNREFFYSTRTRPAMDEFLKSELTTDWRSKNLNSNYGLGAQYDINPKNSISILYSGFTSKLGGTFGNKNNLLDNSGNSFFESNIDKDEVRTNNSVTVNYDRKLDSKGSSLFIGTQYSHYNALIDDFITENRIVNTTDGIRYLENTVDQDIFVSSTQSDYVKVMRNNVKLEAGAKISVVRTEAATNFFVSENGGEFVFDNQLSNKFSYTEMVPAAYLSFSGMVKKVGFGIGARGEMTNYELNTSVGDGQLLTDQYFNLFPNLQLNTTISSTLKLRASYTSRITRPRYAALNPFVIYQDPFTTIEGNPNLIPDKVHAFEIGTNYRDYDFRVGYNYTIDPIDRAALRGSTPNSYVLKAINLDEGHSYFASLSRTLNLKWWTSINTVSVSYDKLIDRKYDFDLVEPAPQLYLYSSNTFDIKNLFKIQLLAWYSGRRQYGIYDDFSRYLVMVGIEKNVLKNKLKLRLLANDIFQRTNAWGDYGVGRTNIYYDRTFNNQYLRFIATWNFGQLKQSKFKIKSTGQSENNRAN
jgi:hypothetical protein